ncbi:MAG: 3-deoxy-D-manno-octulosonic acid transferase [Rickettsiaceae bacterium]
MLLRRLIKGKDTASTFWQKIGYIKLSRPKGKLIWLHAASVGESMIAITLIKSLKKRYPEHNFLVTTCTLAALQTLRKSLSSNTIIQSVPIDQLLIVKLFLHHWQPDLGIFIESEIWPCLITESAKQCNLILVNARLSDKSFKTWFKIHRLFGVIINKFKLVIVQSEADLYKYQQLGCIKPINLGNIKFSNNDLPINQDQRAQLHKILQDKKVFIAASTHKEDEDIILPIIKNLQQENINYYPIIILRHPDRKEEVEKQCQILGLKYSFRASNKTPSLDEDLYIVDTFGELGLFYSLSEIVFVGGSFQRGGHNLLEPANFENVILLGPDMTNFQNITDEMVEKKAAIQVSNATELYNQIKYFCSKSDENTHLLYKKNALHFVRERQHILERYIQQIETFI